MDESIKAEGMFDMLEIVQMPKWSSDVCALVHISQVLQRTSLLLVHHLCQ